MNAETVRAQAKAPRTQPSQPVVYVVDDDEGMRSGMEFLLKANDLRVESYPSAEAFLEGIGEHPRGCVLLDVRMPGMNGLQLQETLRGRDIRLPIIIVTAYGNIPMAVRAMRNGAVDFIEKPCDSNELLARLQKAIELDSDQAQSVEKASEVKKRMASLTTREHEILDCVVAGMLNKQIAEELGIALKTVENHRAHMMSKMEASCAADLVRMVVQSEMA